MSNQLTFAIALVVLIGLLFVVERFVALRRSSRPLLGRLLVNIGLSVLSFAVAMVVVRPAALAVLEWAEGKSFGLIHMVSMPLAAQFALSFLLMDLTFYWWHVANHRIPFLWRFHIGEVALSAGFRVVQVSAIGPSAWMFAVYELVFQANTAFHHSNVGLPIRIERLLNLVLVTPRMHGIHHSQVRDETNSNYSVVFSWWDRLHRTLGLNIPQSDVAIGVPGYADPTDNRLWTDLLLPFRRQREYWRRSDGTLVTRERSSLSGSRSRLAE